MKKIRLVLLFTSCITALFSQNLETTDALKPLDGVVDHTENMPMKALPYPPLRAADILWEKRIWRVIDTRQKMNLNFRYPEMPLFSILEKEIMEGRITAYSPDDDRFTSPMTSNEVFNELNTIDTLPIYDPMTGDAELQIITNQMDPNDVKFYRLKEIWYFDTRTSTLKVRILGIAPIIEVRDENGNVKYKKPLFWLYYPHCRDVLASHEVFNSGNDFSRRTWEDLFEMRFFASYIIKENNVMTDRLEDLYSGREILLKADEIEQEIFTYEHDLWEH